MISCRILLQIKKKTFKEKAIEKIKEYLENIGMWDIKIWDGTIFIEQKKNCITVTGVLKQELLQKY